MVFHFNDPAIGDGHLEYIRGEVTHPMLTRGRGFTVHIPIDVPGFVRDELIEACLFHFIPEPCPEQFGESPYRDQEVRPGRMPGAVLRREGTSRDDVMNVGVIGNLSSPGMEDAGKSGDIPADKAFVCCHGFQGRGRGLEESLIADTLITSDERPYVLGDGEGDHEVVSWHQSFKLFIKPLPGFMVLAGGAVAVTAGTEYGVPLTARLAGIDGEAVFSRAAVGDGMDDLAVLSRHGMAEAADILRAVG